jgi:hypothetical protein
MVIDFVTIYGARFDELGVLRHDALQEYSTRCFAVTPIELELMCYAHGKKFQQMIRL